MLFRVVLVIVHYHNVKQTGWLLRALMFLSLSILHTSCTALQEKLHECVRWFIASSNGVSDTIACHNPVHPTITE